MWEIRPDDKIESSPYHMATQILAKKNGLSVCPVSYWKHIFYEAWLVKSVAREQQEPQQKVRNIKKED